MSDKPNYKKTVNLPNTKFDMRAGLLQKEPAIQKQWAADDLYNRVLAERSDAPEFLLHDGPPYANGPIHIGHTLNKVLKDMTVRIKTMTGHHATYVPGWDCHGLPIEAKVMEELGDKAKTLDAVVIRRICREYAEKFVKLQSKQFQRLGIMGEFDNPYLTMNPAYEAAVLRVFADLVERKIVFRQLKPVHWSIENQTALADAELEHHAHESPSITVAFEMTQGLDALPHKPGDTGALLIWTTTPWTLPANRAVAVHPRYTYSAVHVDSARGPMTVFVAEGRLEAVGEYIQKFGVSDTVDETLASLEIVGTVTGQQLIDAGIQYSHPVDDDRTCPVVPAEYVTLDDGTGLVHTAPGHGTDDYFTGLLHGLDIHCPVLADGTLGPEAPGFLQGHLVWDANPLVIEHLRERNLLVACETITHSYPHDWRSKKPTIFRATEQWFIGVDRPLMGDEGNPTLRTMALDVCNKPADEGGIDFIPAWGKNRLQGMLENRPDWCISRQRSWGLPIPAFFNEAGQPLCTAASVRAVADVVAEQGSDAWYTATPAELLVSYCPADDPDLPNPGDFAIETLTAGLDIFDVWFESGSSWSAVALQRGLTNTLPVDLYLEGSDQHRGWFQLSLLPALGSQGCPPFKTLLTHGFINDAEGKKMSKSLGNTVDVEEQLAKRGADILRLWVASQDYHNDDRCSDELIAQIEDVYRKLRNTLRYCLSLIGDFNPATDATEPEEHSIDLWMRMQLHLLVDQVRKAYDRFDYHTAYRLLYQFCTVEASNVYFSAVKDRLYCEGTNSPRRRATQGVLREMADVLVKLLAPILPHTCEEAWGHIPFKSDTDPASVHQTMLPDAEEHITRLMADFTPGQADLADMDEASILHVGPATIWEQLLDIRGRSLVKLEALRNAGVKNTLDAEVVFTVAEDKPRIVELLTVYLQELEDMLGVGYARVETVASSDASEAVAIDVFDTREKYERCERSRRRRPDVGSNPAYPDLCARDADVMSNMTE